MGSPGLTHLRPVGTMIIGTLRHISRAMTWAVGAALIATAFLVAIEVVLRKVFLIGLSMGTEISSYVLGVAAAWGFALALLERTHVRVDALVRLLPESLAAWADVLALIGLSGFAVVLSWYGFATFMESWSIDARAMTPLATRLWIPQGLWVFGLFFFAFACLVLLIRAVTLLMQGRVTESRALIGTSSATEESLSEVKEWVEHREEPRR